MKALQLIKGWKFLLSLAVALVVYQVTFGLATLNPANIKWMMAAYHDWGTHYLGWAFYRNDPWTFPLGKMYNYYYPIGTNVGFTDSIPLMALVFKLFSGILPENFQYFGLWILSCYFLNAYYTIKILGLYRVRPAITVLAVLLVTANPVLVFRGMHPSLCAHWLLLASLYYYLLPANRGNVLKINKHQAIIFLLSAMINPYLAMMVAGFNLILPLRHFLYDKLLTVKKALLFPTISFAAGLAFWVVFGIIEFSSGTTLDAGNIYGVYSFNLNSFFNSYGFYSHFIPDLGWVTELQHEGFGYLGLGLVILIGIAIIAVLLKLFTQKGFLKRHKALLPLFVLCFLLLVFAVSNKVSWGKEVLFTYPTFGFIEKLGSIFRATGRFSWPIYYMAIIFSVIIFSKIRINYYAIIAAFALLTGLQFYDTENLLTARKLQSGNDFQTKLDDRQWLQVFEKFDAIIAYPPYTNNWVYQMDYQDLAFLALKAGKPISNGYAARENIGQMQIYNDTLTSQLRQGIIKDSELYVTTASHIKAFRGVFHKKKASINKIGGFIFIYSKNKKISGLFQQTAQDRKYLDSLEQAYSKKGNINEMEAKWASTDNVSQFVEQYSFQKDVLQMRGWAFSKSSHNGLHDSTFIALSNSGKAYLFPTTRVYRPDLTEVYKKVLDSSGYDVSVFIDDLPKQPYEIGIVIKDNSGKYHYIKTDKSISTRK